MSKPHEICASWSEEDQLFIARVQGFPSLATHGDTYEEAIKEMEALLQDIKKDLDDEKEEKQ